jgi:hypothetical protein
MISGWQFKDEAHFNAHCRLMTAAADRQDGGDIEGALVLLDAALERGESPNARWNRSLLLLALGRYAEGWEDFQARWWLFADPSPRTITNWFRANLPPWDGEPLRAKRLVLIHDAGFGDTVMLLRYVPTLRRLGEVVFAAPPALARLAAPLVGLVRDVSERDVACTMFDLPRLLKQTPATIPPCPYLKPDRIRRAAWRDRLAKERRPKIGIAWSSIHSTFPKRDVEIRAFLKMLGADGCALFSLQKHAWDEARAHGVEANDFEDFADLAAFIANMDSVVTIDTAALHVAGAIGHPRVNVVLPFVPCWRWHCGNPWYPHVRLCRQQVPGDWPSAFAQVARLR